MDSEHLRAILHRLSAGDVESLDIADRETAGCWHALLVHVRSLAQRALPALMRDHEDSADDIAQDVIVSLTDTRRLQALCLSKNPSAYLFVIVSNRARSMGRSKAARHRQEDAWATQDGVDRETELPFVAADSSVEEIVRRRLESCLRQIADVDR